eukprot:UN19046
MPHGEKLQNVFSFYAPIKEEMTAIYLLKSSIFAKESLWENQTFLKW